MKKAARGADILAEGLFTFSPNDEDRDRMTSPAADVDKFIAKL